MSWYLLFGGTITYKYDVDNNITYVVVAILECQELGYLDSKRLDKYIRMDG